MLTMFTTAKPFTGHNGVIQRNALKSWTLAAADVEVLLFGDEEGAAETAQELGIRHIREVRRTPQGPKILPSFFDAAQRMARHDVVCYANCDIVLMEDFCKAIRTVARAEEKFLMIGRRWDTDIREPIQFEKTGWKDELRHRARAAGKQCSGDWIDYFAFSKGMYLGQLPDLVIGRVFWDQWLVWKAQQLGAAIVDASSEVMAIHQNHDYGYHPTGKTGVWTDELSQRNYTLSGGRWHLRTIDDATHVLTPNGVNRNPNHGRNSARRVVRTTCEALRTATLDWTRPIRHAIGLQRKSR